MQSPTLGSVLGMSAESSSPYRDVDPVEAQHLVEGGEVEILDVRTPHEFEALGHIPGATLLPLDLVPSAVATFPRDGKPILVYCEHGVRSVQAAGFLAQAGFRDVLNLRGGFVDWQGSKEHTSGTPFSPRGPCSWLVENADLLPRQGKALDVACGGGRHALLLAAAGLEVLAVDQNDDSIHALRNVARRLDLPIVAETVDLEGDRKATERALDTEAYALIVCVHYLHRPLFPALIQALAPGGVLLYETFTVDQKKHGKPSNPDFLLEHGELETLVAGLEILKQRDGEFEGRCVASLAGRKTTG